MYSDLQRPKATGQQKYWEDCLLLCFFHIYVMDLMKLGFELCSRFYSIFDKRNDGY